jgi:hypothetical protein
MSITFPASPTAGDKVTQNGRTYIWSGSAWELYGNVAAHAATHAIGGSDPITPAAIGAVSRTGDASVDGNFRVGLTGLEGGLRYSDVGNVASNQLSGAVLRMITLDATNPALTAAAIFVKYRNGQFAIINNEPSSAAHIAFVVNDTERARITSDGLLGVGTTVPALSSGNGIHCNGSTFRLATSRTPASPTATGNQGEICWDSQYLYVCVAANTWRQIPIYKQGTLEASASASATSLDVYPRGEATSLAIAPASGSVFFTFFTPPTTFTVSSITMASGSTAAAGLTTCRFGLYLHDESSAVMVARTASDTSIFGTVNTSYQRSLSTVGGFPATYTLQAGQRYGVGVVVVGTTPPTFAGKAVAPGVSTLTPKTNGTLTGQTDLPTSTTGIVTAQGHPFARLT